MGTGMGGFDRGNSKGRGEIRSWFYLGVSEYQVDDLSDLTRALRFFENPRVSARALVVVLPPRSPLRARVSDRSDRSDRSRRMADAGTPPTVVKRPRRVVATTPGTTARLRASSSGHDDAPRGATPGALAPHAASGSLPPAPPPPWPDPLSTPGLDALRRELVRDLRGAFPLRLDASAFAVVLVCGHLERDDEDWAALVLDIGRGERRGAVLVKPLEMRREEEEDRDEIRDGGGASVVGAPSSSERRRSFRYRLELAKAFPAQEVDAAAIMDRLSFGGDPRDPLVGAVDDRGLPTPVANVAALKRRYAFTPDLCGVRKLALERQDRPSPKDEAAGLLPLPASSPPEIENENENENEILLDAASPGVVTFEGTSAQVVRARAPRLRARTNEPNAETSDRSECSAPPSVPTVAANPSSLRARETTPRGAAREDDENTAKRRRRMMGMTTRGGRGRAAAAAATLREALRTAAPGAVVLSLPVADLEEVLEELERLEANEATNDGDGWSRKGRRSA